MASDSRVLKHIMLASVLVLALILVAVNSASGTITYIQHNPIYINGNSQFTSANGVTGGSGTVNDPYIIEGWKINATGVTTAGLHIKNTTAYFIIRNCFVENANEIYLADIQLDNVKNGTIENNICNESYNAIELNYCYYNHIVGNSGQHDGIGAAGHGIVLYKYSCYNTITHNVFENCSHDGMGMDDNSDFNTIMFNVFDNCMYGFHTAVGCSGNLISHNICTNNTQDGISINSRPDSPAENDIISFNTCLNNVNAGIMLYNYCNYHLVENNVCRNSVYGGIIIKRSNYNTISNNIIDNCGYAIRETDGSVGNIITGNKINETTTQTSTETQTITQTQTVTQTQTQTVTQPPQTVTQTQTITLPPQTVTRTQTTTQTQTTTETETTTQTQTVTVPWPSHTITLTETETMTQTETETVVVPQPPVTITETETKTKTTTEIYDNFEDSTGTWTTTTMPITITKTKTETTTTPTTTTITSTTFVGIIDGWSGAIIILVILAAVVSFYIFRGSIWRRGGEVDGKMCLWSWCWMA